MKAEEIAGAAAAFFGGYTGARKEKKREDRQEEQWTAYHDLAVRQMEQSEARYRDAKALDEMRFNYQKEQDKWRKEQAMQVSPNNVYSSLINQGYTPDEAQGVAEGRIPASALGPSPAMQLRQQAAARAGGGGGSRGGGGMDFTAAQTAAMHEAAMALGIPIGTPEYKRIFNEGLSMEQAAKLRKVQEQQTGLARLDELQRMRNEVAIKAEGNVGGIGPEAQNVLDQYDQQIAAVKQSLGGKSPQQSVEMAPAPADTQVEGRNPDGTRKQLQSRGFDAIKEFYPYKNWGLAGAAVDAANQIRGQMTERGQNPNDPYEMYRYYQEMTGGLDALSPQGPRPLPNTSETPGWMQMINDAIGPYLQNPNYNPQAPPMGQYVLPSPDSRGYGWGGR